MRYLEIDENQRNNNPLSLDLWRSIASFESNRFCLWPHFFVKLADARTISWRGATRRRSVCVPTATSPSAHDSTCTARILTAWIRWIIVPWAWHHWGPAAWRHSRTVTPRVASSNSTNLDLVPTHCWHIRMRLADSKDHNSEDERASGN